MSTKYTHLFTPFKIGNMTVKNRFVLPAMGLKKFESKGSISAEGIEYFTQFAKGGFGLIVSNSLVTDIEIDKNTRFDRLSPMFHERNFISSFTECTDRVHASGAKMIAQISMGVGRNGQFKSASENPSFFDPSFIVGELTKDEIKRKIELQVEGARRCKEAGFRRRRNARNALWISYGPICSQPDKSAYRRIWRLPREQAPPGS